MVRTRYNVSAISWWEQDTMFQLYHGENKIQCFSYINCILFSPWYSWNIVSCSHHDRAETLLTCSHHDRAETLLTWCWQQSLTYDNLREQCFSSHGENKWAMFHLYHGENKWAMFQLYHGENKWAMFQLHHGENKWAMFQFVRNTYKSHDLGTTEITLKINTYNFILNTGNFPEKWNESFFLVLLHKSGNKLEPSNYRGISITSNLGNVKCFFS
jgi:hypothetical protein